MSSTPSGPAVAPSPQPGPSGRDVIAPGAVFALAVLFSMNLLNYVDRYSFFAVGTQIQDDLRIGDAGFGV